MEKQVFKPVYAVVPKRPHGADQGLIIGLPQDSVYVDVTVTARGHSLAELRFNDPHSLARTIERLTLLHTAWVSDLQKQDPQQVAA